MTSILNKEQFNGLIQTYRYGINSNAFREFLSTFNIIPQKIVDMKVSIYIFVYGIGKLHIQMSIYSTSKLNISLSRPGVVRLNPICNSSDCEMNEAFFESLPNYTINRHTKIAFDQDSNFYFYGYNEGEPLCGKFNALYAIEESETLVKWTTFQ